MPQQMRAAGIVASDGGYPKLLGNIATPAGILKEKGPVILGNAAAPTGILKAQGDSDAGQPLPSSANMGDYLPKGFLPVNADVQVFSSSKQWLPATLCGIAICDTDNGAAGTLHIRYQRGGEKDLPATEALQEQLKPVSAQQSSAVVLPAGFIAVDGCVHAFERGQQKWMQAQVCGIAIMDSPGVGPVGSMLIRYEDGCRRTLVKAPKDFMRGNDT